MDIKLKFLGAARNVTGSSYLLEANDTRLMIDCGLYQERNLRSRNWEPFLIPPDTLDALLLTHAHIDHCGLTPKLVRDGFNNNIYCTPATLDITEIMLQDSAKLQEEDASFKARRHKREGRKGPHPEVPLYTVEDAQNAMSLLSPIEYEKPLQLGDGITATFYDAGHVFGSSMIMISVVQSGQERKILFSGDVGRWDAPILKDPTVFKMADYVITESTYGNRLHEDSSDISNHLAEVVNSTLQAGGNIVIPSFALERAQELLYHLNEMDNNHQMPEFPIFLDSPMAIKITEVFKRHTYLYDREMTELINRNNSPFDLENLKITQTTDESKAIKDNKGTSMIIAGSGMCNGGRIKHHLISNITRPESTILFIGYQAVGTLGRQIVDGAQKVRILGQHYPVKARVVQIQGLSSHADRDELLRWLSGLKTAPKHVFVTHGSSNATQSFSNLLHEKMGWNTSAPEYKTEVLLD
ncbi:MAG: MBL fold metallo-hydrolase [Dehalococcoidia bacterium]|nr:MBL fold metallo-hydrolase [Dehalococcoidia bacterium]